MKRTFVSINRCVAVIVYNSPWLAFCAGGLNIDIEEISLAEPKRVHEVELQYVGQNTRTSTDYDHTVLLFTLNNGEDAIVADESYAQYSFDNGIDTFREYLATKVLRCDEHAAWRHALGQSFDDWKESEDVWQQSKTEVTIRVTNNVLVRGLEAFGGIKTLLDIAAEGFETARDEILTALKGEMEVLRQQLELIAHGPPVSFLEKLGALVGDCDGAGHQLCMQSYQRRAWPFRCFELFD